MREIKFRAWDKIDKKMYPVRSIIFNEKYEVERILVLKEENGAIYLHEILAPLFILLPYTGLKDNNYKEIYEGDIVVCHADNWDYIGVVKYDETYDTGSYALEQTRKSNNEIVDLIMPRFTGDPKEVIGNIYENPELLEETK